MQLLHTNDANLECALVSLSVESSRAEVFLVWRYDCFLMFFMADPDTTRRFRLHSHTANGEMIKNLMLCSLPEVFLLELQYLLCQSHACVCVQSQLHMCALSPLFFSSPLFSWQPISSVAIVTLHSLSALFWKSNLIEPKTKHPPLHTHTHTHSHAHTPLTCHPQSHMTVASLSIPDDTSANTYFPLFYEAFQRPKFSSETNKPLLFYSFSTSCRIFQKIIHR